MVAVQRSTQQLHLICRHSGASKRRLVQIQDSAGKPDDAYQVPELQAGWPITQLGCGDMSASCGGTLGCIGGTICTALTMPLHACRLHMQCYEKLACSLEHRAFWEGRSSPLACEWPLVTSLHNPQPLQLWQLRYQIAQEAQCRKQEGIQEPYVSSLQSLLKTWRHTWEVSAHPQSFTSHTPPRAAELTQSLLLFCVVMPRAPGYECERHACSLQASLTHAYLLPTLALQLVRNIGDCFSKFTKHLFSVRPIPQSGQRTR